MTGPMKDWGMNFVVLSGTILEHVHCGKTTMGDMGATVLLGVDTGKQYQEEIRVSTYGDLAHKIAALPVGTEVIVTGMLKSRYIRVDSGTRILSTEVLARRIK